jgi:hypothetical protein
MKKAGLRKWPEFVFCGAQDCRTGLTPVPGVMNANDLRDSSNASKSLDGIAEWWALQR